MRKLERDMLLEKIEEWVDKAELELDPFDEYISLFIAYNIFYNLYKKTKDSKADLLFGDSKRAIETVELMDVSTLFDSLREDLSNYVELIPIFRSEFWSKQDRSPIDRLLKEGFEKEQKAIVIEALLKWLYRVRCNLVHGEKNYNDKQQKRLLKQSSALMAKIIRHTLMNYKQIYVQGEKQSIFE